MSHNLRSIVSGSSSGSESISQGRFASDGTELSRSRHANRFGARAVEPVVEFVGERVHVDASRVGHAQAVERRRGAHRRAVDAR